MKRRYQSEIDELPDSYREALGSDWTEDIARVSRIQGPMVFVGSGGALAIAHLAAELHMRETGELAIATTPLGSMSLASTGVGVVLFSARARHPDAVLAIEGARNRGANHLGVVTCRPRADLPSPLSEPDVVVATVPSRPDGFLATNSLLMMSVALCLAHDVALPPELPAFGMTIEHELRSLCVVLTGPRTGAVGIDLEARLVETGLASVQLSDYRNMAHGRHVGLKRRLAESTVVGVIDADSAPLADATLSILPTDVDVLPLRTDLSWPVSVLDLFVQSIKVTGMAGIQRGIDPGQPGVSDFGRRLYHLPVKQLLAEAPLDPVSRKLRGGAQGPTARSAYENALYDWLSEIKSERIRGLVLDYDGTCVPTWDRFVPPPLEIQEELIRLLDAGLVVGFATGRGKSFHKVTRSWLPELFWNKVIVGLYNGTTLLTLADTPPDSTKCDGVLRAASERLDTLAEFVDLLIERRSTQVSVADVGGGLTGAQLVPMVRSVLGRPPVLDLKVLGSGHAADVVLPDQGKVAVLDAVRDACNGSVLTIGDQGQPDGNDFELLAATALSMSVDQCSADPTRCWNLDRQGQRGTPLLRRYLHALHQTQSGFKFKWSTP